MTQRKVVKQSLFYIYILYLTGNNNNFITSPLGKERFIFSSLLQYGFWSIAEHIERTMEGLVLKTFNEEQSDPQEANISL